MNFSPLVVIPSYNTGAKLLRQTVDEALRCSTAPVMVVVDGSSDGSDKALADLVGEGKRVQLIRKSVNQGKGAAVRTALIQAKKLGYSHALVMDADGQHPADRIEDFLAISRQNPEAMILGQPVFDQSVPVERLHGRKLSVWLVGFEALSSAIGDPLYGFRVYPIEPLLEVMSPKHRSNRYDFDPEVAVRLHWSGVPAIKVPAKVDYLSKEQGGVSHFHYLRDNLRYVCLHSKLITEAPFRWLLSAMRRKRRENGR